MVEVLLEGLRHDHNQHQAFSPEGTLKRGGEQTSIVSERHHIESRQRYIYPYPFHKS